MLSGIIFGALAASSAFAQTVEYIAPALDASLDSASIEYQLGVWAFLLFLVVMVAAVYTVGSVDFSNDTLLMVEVEKQGKTE